MPMRFLQHLVTGTATGVGPASAAGAIAGRSLMVNGVQGRKVCDLSALVTVDAETNTITAAVRWQGSNDASTWYNLATSPQNAAPVALATGTAGADATVVRSVEAPPGAYSYNFARVTLEIGTATGTDNDTWELSYSYRQLSPADKIY